MEERKFIKLKKEEDGIKEYIKRDLGKGKISRLDIEYTPVGEKITICTAKPGMVIGRRGEKIEFLTKVLKTKFKFENPHIEIKEIENILFDAQYVADDLAMALERMGNLRFKVIAYKKLQEIMRAGALGCELRLTGKLPSSRAKSWRFAEGYLKKAGESRKEVDRAEAIALTKTGIIGIKVAIMTPSAKIYDRIDINDEMKSRIRGDSINLEESEGNKKETKKINKKEGKTKVKKDKEEILTKTKVIKESPDLNPEEDGTAMKIEEEIEDGIPADEKEFEKKVEEVKGDKK